MRWALLVLWLLVASGVSAGFYDIYVSRGAREYLQASAEADLGRRAEPSMVAIMEANQRAGRRAGTYWFVVIVTAGWATVWLAARKRT